MIPLKKEKAQVILYEKYRLENEISDLKEQEKKEAFKRFRLPKFHLHRISPPVIRIPKFTTSFDKLPKISDKKRKKIVTKVAATLAIVFAFACILLIINGIKNDGNANVASSTNKIQEQINSVVKEIDNIKGGAKSDEYYKTLLGKNGVKGATGADGKDGVNGVAGVDGKDGLDGAAGVDGKDGVAGKNGLNGKDGINGANGKDGEDGISAYQIAKGAGYTGTEEEFAKVMAETPDKLKQYGIDLNNLNTTLNSNVLALNNSLQENVIKINGKIVENVDSLNAALGITQDNIDELDKALQDNNVIINGKIVDTAEALSTSLNTNVQTLNQTILDSFNTVNSTIASNYKEYTENNTIINNKISSLEDQVEECFQSVSSGKAKVASAITDKGVTTDSDATFQVMHDNILTLAMQQYNTGYADGLAAINNAKVTYTRHYHTGSSTTGGGCYTVHNIHHHTGDATNGGGCYGSPIYREDPVYAACPNNGWHKAADNDWEWGSKDANGDRKYVGICNVCGYRYSSYHSFGSFPAHTSAVPTSYNKVLTGYSLTCGYSEGQDLGWSVGCGYTDGQILSATIKY